MFKIYYFFNIQGKKSFLREKVQNLQFHQFPLKKFEGYFLQFPIQNQSLAVMEGMARIKKFLFLQAFVLWKVFALFFFKFIKVGDNDCGHTRKIQFFHDALT